MINLTKYGFSFCLLVLSQVADASRKILSDKDSREIIKIAAVRTPAERCDGTNYEIMIPLRFKGEQLKAAGIDSKRNADIEFYYPSSSLDMPIHICVPNSHVSYSMFNFNYGYSFCRGFTYEFEYYINTHQLVLIDNTN